MKRTLLSRLIVVAVLVFSSSTVFAQSTSAAPAPPAILSVDQIQPGMRGVAYTVFEGVKPETMEVEILGVMPNAAGPKGDIILARLHGKKVEYTGVVAGMSGSPVYIDGKLVGAIAYRIGEFSREPIAGITPIAQMLEINELDKTAPPHAGSASGATPASGPGTSGSPAPGQGYSNVLKPIETPLVFTGFTEDAMNRFGEQFAAAGVVPVMGAGAVANTKQPEALEPGSSVGALLVRGDLNIAATCTVTYVDPQRLLACGHPLMRFGLVDMPMTKSRVLATLPSPMNAFKIATSTEPVGAFVQDRHTGILGRFGRDPEMIPVTLRIHGGSTPKVFRYEVLNNARLTPVAMMATLFSALQGVNDSGEHVTYRMNGRIAVNGYPDVQLQNMFSPSDGGQPTAFSAAISLGERFGRIYQNAYDSPSVSGVELDFDLVGERRSAQLESARTDVTEARPGDEIVIEAVLRPYRGERIVRQIPVRIPTSTPRGNLRIMVSDGDTLDRTRRMGTAFGRGLDLGSTIALLNKEHANNRLYVSLLEANPQAMVEDKVMPGLPLSIMNMMEGMRGTREMVVVGESAVTEASTPLDYVISGGQVISVSVK
ncbi:MAG: SpoIVB peptidase S55 domain-containing protein [Candidatus Korobacteraceae bacterium]